jgi:transposase
MHERPSVAADLSSLDRETLAALVLAQQEKLLSRDSEIEHLKLIIAKLRRMMFGTKSERVAREIEQLELKLEDLEVRKAERAEGRPGSEPSRQRPSRQPLPEHLPR